LTNPPKRNSLGFPSLLALGINGVIGVGIFFAPAEVAAQMPGYAGALVFLLAGLALMPVAVVFSALGGRFAEDGGPYVWARLAFGPQLAFLIGFLTYISSVLSMAAVVTGLSAHVHPALGPGFPLGPKGLTVLTVLLLAGTAATGLRLSATAWNTVTVLKLAPLIMLSALGAYAMLGEHAQASAAAVVSSNSSLDRALLIVVFALQGFEVVPVLSGSCQSPREAGWATLGALSACTLFYTGLHALCVYALPDLAAHSAPLVDAARVLGGPVSEHLVSVGQTVSAIGIAFGQTVITPRYLAALGHLDALGPWIGAEDVRRVPQRALWLTILAVILFTLREDLGGLLALSSTAVLLQYIVATLALAQLARTGAHGVDRKQQYWALPALIGIALVAKGVEPGELITTAFVTTLGVLLLFLRRKQVARTQRARAL